MKTTIGSIPVINYKQSTYQNHAMVKCFLLVQIFGPLVFMEPYHRTWSLLPSSIVRPTPAFLFHLVCNLVLELQKTSIYSPIKKSCHKSLSILFLLLLFLLLLLLALIFEYDFFKTTPVPRKGLSTQSETLPIIIVLVVLPLFIIWGHLDRAPTI